MLKEVFDIIKKFGFTNKAVVLLLAVSLPLTVFAGCQSKNNSANAAVNPVANSGNNGGGSQNGAAPNLDKFKQRTVDNVQALVDDKTITKDQADKIVAALTENRQGNNQNNSKNAQQSNNQGTAQNGQNPSQNNNQGNGQSRQGGRKSSALNKLVTDGVITQEQADAVMQKVRGNFNRPQNNQNQQTNQSQPNIQNSQGS